LVECTVKRVQAAPWMDLLMTISRDFSDMF
jgi:hypothetical protein